MGNAIEVFLLMYADDIILLGDTVLGYSRKYPPPPPPWTTLNRVKISGEPTDSKS